MKRLRRHWVVPCGLLMTAYLSIRSAHAAEPTSGKSRFGIGIGSGTIANGVSGKYLFGGGAFQGVVGFWGGGGSKERFRHVGGLAGSFDYLFEMPELTRSQYFSVGWSFGLGGGFGVKTFDDGSPALAVSGIAGLEFNFTRLPIDLVVEYRPTIGILPKAKIELVDFTAHVRAYVF